MASATCQPLSAPMRIEGGANCAEAVGAAAVLAAASRPRATPRWEVGALVMGLAVAGATQCWTAEFRLVLLVHRGTRIRHKCYRIW